ncbi:hypothetical protein [Rhodoferax sediminis]|uniref:Uncharacterized protein n=1 Tax=Rhodoferax sediminis TaxID=2509614 RepID=A0A515DDV6_9BURK|nr:hypothetical protein [Rhodoferax sediminis]QDL38569.1 hypothetical protein EUB48_15700 [Rhodoferax sediminis]
MDQEQYLETERIGSVGVIRLAAEQTRNSLSNVMREALCSCISVRPKRSRGISPVTVWTIMICFLVAAERLATAVALFPRWGVCWVSLANRLAAIPDRALHGFAPESGEPRSGDLT